MRYLNAGRIPICIALLLLFYTKSSIGQNSFSIPDSVFVFNKTTNHGIVHFYIEIINDLNIDTTLRWKVHFSDSFPTNWVVEIDDQNNSYDTIMEGDSADFTLYTNLAFPQKMIIGNDHNQVASVNDTVRFDIYHPENPANYRSMYFVFNIVEPEPASIRNKSNTNFMVFPNPAVGLLHCNDQNITDLKLFEAAKKKLKNWKLTDDQISDLIKSFGNKGQ
jgi:hypothetical protein